MFVFSTAEPSARKHHPASEYRFVFVLSNAEPKPREHCPAENSGGLLTTVMILWSLCCPAVFVLSSVVVLFRVFVLFSINVLSSVFVSYVVFVLSADSSSP